MATYDFSRLRILLVEDNNYVRSVFQNLLNHFGFAQVLTAKNGAEAVETMKLPGGVHVPGLPGIDIVISDLIMAPVDGQILLRWLRGAKDSPNRFMPFIMLSGAADIQYVSSARDLGANEFLAKPFSAETVYRRLLEIIDHPRPFITSRTYFGPDRRRRDVGPPDKERRVTRDSDISLVYSGDKIVKPTNPTEVWKFILPNRLKGKVGGLGGGEMGEIPVSILEDAEAELEKAATDFTEWAGGYLAKLSKFCEQALEQTEGRRKYFNEINLLAHELRGQGGTFGYPLMSTFGKMLYDVTGSECREDDNAVEIVKAHIDAMRAVLREKISGSGGNVGRELLKSLEIAVEKLTSVE
ncbi:MAG: response regulator [Rhodospirillales bacterium]|nr:response regulator [Rhodospirillales bacterium]